jgi:tRNA threonylcarbamoyladenosine biosynthesis protein TsaB
MTILALEFSSSQRSVAVLRPDGVTCEAAEAGGRSTAALGMIERVLAEAKMEREEIEVIAVGLGPGSYTGIRAGIALAQGWQLARGVQLLGISSVEAVVAQAQAERIFGQVNVVIDAQRSEFYQATYEVSAADWNETRALRIVPLVDLQSEAGKYDWLIGPEAARWHPRGRIVFPQAAGLARLAAKRGDYVPGERLEPVYLRATNFVKSPPVNRPVG